MNKIVRGPYGAYEVLAVSYQRNGSSGLGFFSGLVLVVDGEMTGPRPIWRRCSPPRRAGPRARRASRPTAASALRPSMTSNASRSEEHTSELQSLMRSSYAVFCLKKKNSHI